MKKLIYTALSTVVLMHLCTGVHSQTAPDSNIVERFLLDLSVPDMPAFKALGTDPSTILRPADIKKFAVMISPFFSNVRGVIPKNFGLETAPWKLTSGKWTLHEFNTNWWKRFAYRSSFSLGAINDETEFPSKLAAGYRVSFLSKRADIYRAAEIRNLFAKQMGVMASFTLLTNFWVTHVVTPAPPPLDQPTWYQTHVSEFNEFLSTIDSHLANHPDSTLQGLYDQFIGELSVSEPGKEFTPEELKDIIQVFGKSIDDFIDDYKKKNWNASRLDLGLAWVGRAKDSLLSNTEFSSFSLWVTQAMRVGTGGQLLIGVNTVLPRSGNDSTRIDFTSNLRFYIGTEDFRGFLETQYKYKRYEPNNKSLLVNLGAEFRLGSSFWVFVSAGVDNYLNEEKPLNKLVSNIDLRYGFNKRR